MDSLIEYVKTMDVSHDVITWLETTGKKNLTKGKTTISELEHIVDYLVSPKSKNRILKMSFQDAKRKTKEWMEANIKKGRNLIDNDDDIEVIHWFEDGSMIVKLLTDKALKREGNLMSHCLNPGVVGDDSEIYSYRDCKNMPHCTFELRREYGEITQIKGKGNGDIHPKYINPILEFLRTIDIKIRKEDMKHLGYYEIDDETIEFLSIYSNINLKTANISGVEYVY